MRRTRVLGWLSPSVVPGFGPSGHSSGHFTGSQAKSNAEMLTGGLSTVNPHQLPFHPWCWSYSGGAGPHRAHSSHCRNQPACHVRGAAPVTLAAAPLVRILESGVATVQREHKHRQLKAGRQSHQEALQTAAQALEAPGQRAVRWWSPSAP
ncbi:hypothetical protein BKA56DRAFT_608058 [Ilyonectria sp. MPI-CAGE-AT-0026]|nr:hypothetical protein BKA56DRAFT_608058 [Ilyonectria sp. MPI-CAGE-AT-0026]